MELTLAVQKNEHQYQVYALNTENKEVTHKIIDTIDVADEKPQVLFALKSELESRLEQNKFYPVFDREDFFGQDSAELERETLETAYLKAQSRWVLLNNLQTIEKLIPTSLHLKQLWNKDRYSFFEELWFSIYRNLGTSELKIIFNDVNEVPVDKEKGQKAKLIQSKVEGTIRPELQPGSEEEKLLMENYTSRTSQQFTFESFEKISGKLVAHAQLGKSPIIIMAKCPQLTALQKSILKGLFEGLQG